MGFKTDYKDDIINTTSNEKRQYEMIQNDNGTVSFNDVTVYEQVGDTLGAKELNEISEKLNISGERIRYNSNNDMVQILNDDGVWEDWSSGITAVALIKNGVIISDYSSYESEISTVDNFLLVHAPSSGANYISLNFDFVNYAGKYIKIVAKSDSPSANIIITTSGMETIYFNLAETEKSLYFPITEFMKENGFLQLSFSVGSTAYIKTIEITSSDGTEGGGGSDASVELTQAEYDALPDTKLTDNKNYFIKDGKGGGSGGGYSETLLYENTDKSTSGTITLSDSILNYNQIVFEVTNSNTANCYVTSFSPYLVSAISDKIGGQSEAKGLFLVAVASSWRCVYLTTETSITIGEGDALIKRIYGIKY